jgi:hypothetical protein
MEEMIEEARRLEPLKGFEESEWRTFLRMAMVDMRRASRWSEGTEKHSKERRGSSPSMMDTIRKVETSLELPQQPGELAKEEEHRWKAVDRLRNPPPMRDDVATSTSSTPSYYGWERASHERLHESQRRETGLPTVPVIVRSRET